MTIQAHMSGQIPRQVPNQDGSLSPGLAQQNGSSLPSRIQNLGAHRNTGSMDPDIVRARKGVQVKIYDYITRRRSCPQIVEPKRVVDIVRRLDDVLFRSAATKEDYAELDTLESRLHGLIKGLPLSSHNQQFPQAVNSFPAISPMTSTPGVSRSGSSNLMVKSSIDAPMIAASACNRTAPTTVDTGNLSPPGSSASIHSDSFNSSDGSPCNGYQQPTSSFCIASGGNSMTSPMSGRRITSQRIPTPGFNSNDNQSYMNSESSIGEHGQKAGGT